MKRPDRTGSRRSYRVPFESNEWHSASFDGFVTSNIYCGANTSLGFAAGSKISIFSWINTQTLIGEHSIIGSQFVGGILFEQNGTQLKFWFNTGNAAIISTFSAAKTLTIGLNFVGIIADNTTGTCIFYINNNSSTVTDATLINNMISTPATYIGVYQNQSNTGSQKYWFDGLPAEGIQKLTNDTGTQKFWFDGLPAEYTFPNSSKPFSGNLYDVMLIATNVKDSQAKDIRYGRIPPTNFDCRLWQNYRLGHSLDLSNYKNNGIIDGNVRFV